jgi:hypothetical protein
MWECLKRLPDFWFPDRMAFWGVLLAMPALLFFQTTVHEGTHALNYLIVTGDFPKLAPFPHLSVTNPTFAPDQGRFQAGVTLGQSVPVMKGTCADPTRRPGIKLPGFIALPQFVDLLLMGILTLIFLYTKMPNALIRFLLRTWFVGLCVDFMFNTARGLIRVCVDAMDWSKFMLEYGIGRSWFAVLTWLLWAGVISLIVLACRSRWLEEPVAETGFWDYKWIALLCGVLSFFALLFSIFVSDPKIDKSSVAFIVFFVIQVGALCWYWFYFFVLVRGDNAR